jgi:hypothetical protein
MNRSALSLLLPLLASCDFHSKNPSKDDGNVMINADDSGQVSFNFPFAKGSVKLPESMIHNGNMVINGVPMIPGGKMNGFHLDTANKASVVTMNFTAPQSPDEVRSYFVDEFKKRDVDASLAGDMVTGKSKDGSPFTIEVKANGSGSQGRINIQDKG